MSVLQENKAALDIALAELDLEEVDRLLVERERLIKAECASIREGLCAARSVLLDRAKEEAQDG